MLTFDQFADRVISTLNLDAPDDADQIDEHLDLYDQLGVDSFQAFQLIVMSEALAGSEIPPLELPDLYTLGDVYDYYRRLVHEPVTRTSGRPAE